MVLPVTALVERASENTPWRYSALSLKRITSHGLLGFVGLIAPTASATLIYQYTGSSYTIFLPGNQDSGRYTNTMMVTGTITLASALPPNLALSNVLVLDFAFNDGAISFVPGNGSTIFAQLSTDGSGNVIAPYLVILNQSLDIPAGFGPYIRVIDEPPTITEADVGVFGSGPCVQPFCNRQAAISQATGVWTLVPEPSTGLLAMGGVLCFTGMRRRSQ
jgi:hypothetical protein